MQKAKMQKFKRKRKRKKDEELNYTEEKHSIELAIPYGTLKKQ